MIEFKEEHHDELRKFSLVPIQSEVLTLTSEHPSSVDNFDRKLQAKLSEYEQILEKLEEYLIPLKQSDCDKLHPEMKDMKENISTMLAKLHDKYDKKTEKQLQPMSVNIAEISSK